MQFLRSILLFAACIIVTVHARTAGARSSSTSAESNSRESDEYLGPLPVSEIRKRPKPTFSQQQRPAVTPQGQKPSSNSISSQQETESDLQVAASSGKIIGDLPFDRDDFRNYVVDLKPIGVSKVQEADCSVSINPYRIQKPGYMIGIWDEKDSFTNIEKIKCLRGKDDDSDEDDSDEIDDDVHFELDSNQNETIVLNPTNSTAHKPSCPDGYLLTGLTKTPGSYDLAEVSGHCLKLIRGKLDYEVCEYVPATSKQGGNFEPYLFWNVECQFGHAATGLKMDGKRVKSMRCCKLTPSYP